MQSVFVVAAELGVNTLEGGVTVGLRLLDTVENIYQRQVLSSVLFMGHLSSVEDPKSRWMR